MRRNKKALNIYVDWQPMIGRGSGVANYVGNIFNAIKNIDNYNNYYLYSFSFKRKDHKLSTNFFVKYIKLLGSRIYIKIINSGISFPIEFLTFKSFDIYFWGNFFVYPHIKGKSILVVHDLAHIHYPNQVESGFLNNIKKQLPASLNKVSKIITPSGFIKNELIKEYNIDPNKISVLYPLINYDLYDKALLDIKNTDSIPLVDDASINSKYILFIGNLEPKKNLEGLIDAYNLLDESLKEEYKLVVISSLGWNNKSIINKLNNNKHIINLGYVNDYIKAKLLTSASLLVLPSFYEGFGIPPIEALYSSVPVAVSDIPVFHETLVDAAVFFNPKDPEDISLKISNILKDESLRKKILENGIKRIEYIKNLNQARELLNIILSL